MQKYVYSLGVLLAACGGGGGGSMGDDAPVDARGPAQLTGPVMIDPAAAPAQKLSQYQLFTWTAQTGFTFNDRVVPYDLNTPLFSDYALKQRAIYVPPGQAATYDADAALAFPVGSVIVKTFSFATDLRTPTDPKLVETRLLVRAADGWKPMPYIWDADQRDATYSPGGEVRPIDFTDLDGNLQHASYLVPQRNQCESCHTLQDQSGAISMVLIGVKARHINRDYDYGGAIGVVNTLDHLTELGMLTGAPASAAAPKAYDFRPIEAGGPGVVPAAELDTAARAYLDINCSHCHNPHGNNGITSQLFLDHGNPDLFHLGVCKRPGSAGVGYGGLTFDIVPGAPDSSILYFRDHTTQVGAIMPLLGRSVTHADGAALLHDWIGAMATVDCNQQQPSP